jgi:signal transduction histidine kinase
MESLLTSIIQKDVASLQAAKGLETALLNQRGYVSYYILEADPAWLEQLGKARQAFDERLKEARAVDRRQEHNAYLDKIESEYRNYIEAKDRVIALYKAGRHEEGAKLHREVRGEFFNVLKPCEEHIEIHSKTLSQTWAQARKEALRLRIIAGGAISAAVIIGVVLSFALVTQVLDPIRRLAVMAGGDKATREDEVAALRHGVRGLIDDVGQTHMELEKSRERLIQSEKMATVGKLAAEVAHSIRNPMTSINMRLFSLKRSLEMSPTQQEDFQVISDEMRHLDNIVRNFLEFSRPPKLKLQKTNVSDVMDSALQLLEKRLERDGVTVERHRRQPLPIIEADPELLKEVLVNLIVNSCEAMTDGGVISITEEDGLAEELGRAIVVRVTDNGPGIPESIRQKVMQPFFSTKKEGTGLGLSTASRIIEEHGGRLDLRSEEGQGATFIITLPVAEE